MTTRATRVREFLAGIGGMDAMDVYLRIRRDGVKADFSVVAEQTHADRLIPKLLKKSVDLRVVWAELSGYVDFRRWFPCRFCEGSGTIVLNYGDHQEFKVCPCDCRQIDWLILSGSQTEPTDLAALRRVIADCRAAGVPVRLRNIGARPYDSANRISIDGPGSHAVDWPISDPTGSDPSEWPADLRVRETPKCLMEVV